MLGWTIRFTRNHRISTKYLEEMAAKGWMLKICGESFLFFKKCEPKRLRFAVDYMAKERHQFLENRKSPQVQEYLDLCEECGWRFVDGDGYLYIFCTEDEKAAPLQTDAKAYLNSIHYRKQSKLIKMIIALILILVFYGFPLVRDYSQLLLSEGSSIVYLMFGFLLVTVLSTLIDFALMLHQERRMLELGQLPDWEASGQRGQWERWIRPVVRIGIYGTLLYFSGYRSMWSLLVLLVSVYLLRMVDGLLHHMAWNHFRRLHVVKETLLSLVVEIMMVVVLLGIGLMPRAERPTTDPGIVVSQDWDPPIVMADLGRESYPDRVTKDVGGSSMAREYSYHEGLGKDYISYDIYVSDNESAVMMQMIGDKYYQFREKVRLDVLGLGLDDAISWVDRDGTSLDIYWLRSGNYVMKMYTGFSPTEDQIKIMAESFLQWIQENPFP